MNVTDLKKKIGRLAVKYGREIKNRPIYVVIETTDGDAIVGELTGVGVWKKDNGEMGLDFVAKGWD